MTIADRAKQVLDAVAQAAVRSGRDTDAVTVVAVTKTRTAEDVEAVLRAGIMHAGENRLQEARGKIPLVTHPAVWHLVGHLQSNKAREAAGLFDCIDSVDSLKIAGFLDAEARRIDKVLDVLIQVNISGEAAKSGVDPTAAMDLASEIAGLYGLRPRGLMTIGTLGANEETARREFARMRELFDSLRGVSIQGSWDTLSMGMSGDFVRAIEEGSTMVRIGTALFGERD